MSVSSASNPKSHDDPSKLVEYLLNLIGSIPQSTEKPHPNPAERSRAISSSAAVNAAVTSGALALPPGPLGWLTVLPDVVAIWKLQARLVADIAAVHNKTELLTRENMLYCLFRHSAALAVRELVVQVGNRVLVRRLSADLIQAIVRKIGIKLSQKVVGETVSRLIPIIGAIGVGAFAYYDTAEVARTTREFFERDIAIEPEEHPGRASLRAFNGKYVCSDFDKGAILIADRSESQVWERFRILPVDKDGLSVALMSATQSWLCCDGDHGCQIIANRDKVEAWETFQIQKIDEHRVSFRAFNSRPVYVDADRGYTLWADKEVSGAPTEFTIEYFRE